MTRQSTSQAPRILQFRQILAGLCALAYLATLFFVLLRWRVNTPELHLDFGALNPAPTASQGHE